MQKTFCDKCGRESTNDTQTVRVEFMSMLPRIYAFKHLCPSCAVAFMQHLDLFMPDFLPKPIPPKRSWSVWRVFE
jgi:hypothetical protein